MLLADNAVVTKACPGILMRTGLIFASKMSQNVDSSFRLLQQRLSLERQEESGLKANKRVCSLHWKMEK